ncbi:MAG TPA: calcium-binding protein [Beijerinckiaceae bacterium]|nr:calcium-binding protein [Beijerinckiaceae bacterium]
MATIIGNNSVNVLTGTNGRDVLKGLGGNDTLRGLGGPDLLDGGTGIDTMLGGLGNDTYIVDTRSDVVVEDAGGGIDRVLSSVSYALRPNVENLTLTGVAAIAGTGNGLSNVITGNNANNILSGLAGNDTLLGRAGHDRLDGGAGNDRMIGGLGNDVYRVNAGDVVVEAPSGGIDRIESSISFNLTATPHVENLTLLGAAFFGFGNNLNNVIIGTTAGNALSGGFGNDILIGGLGGDSLAGGPGADIYRYRSVAESATPFPDSIDLVSFQGDKIDLSAIDANVLVSGNQAFRFIGETAFTRPGQVNFATEIDFMTFTSRTTISANVDADAAPEFILTIPSFTIIPTIPTASDFIL